jgi:competence protein ComEA
MIKKLMLGLAAFVLTMGCAFAAVEVNNADQSALDGVRGIGPKLSKTILNERQKGGVFKDWDDLEKRVSGIGAKSSDKLSRAGLSVNGLAKPNAPTAAKTTQAAGSPKK